MFSLYWHCRETEREVFCYYAPPVNVSVLHLMLTYVCPRFKLQVQVMRCHSALRNLTLDIARLITIMWKNMLLMKRQTEQTWREREIERRRRGASWCVCVYVCVPCVCVKLNRIEMLKWKRGNWSVSLWETLERCKQPQREENPA